MSFSFDRLRKPAALLSACALTSLGLLTAAAPRHTPAIPNGGTVIAAEGQIQGTLNPLCVVTTMTRSGRPHSGQRGCASAWTL